MDSVTLSLRRAENGKERDALYTAMCACGRHSQMLYEDDSLATWRTFTNPGDAWTYAVLVEGTVAAVAVVNGFSGRSAFVHFCVLAGYDALAVDMGRYVVRWLLQSFSCLLGATPAPYRHVLRMVGRLGFRRQFVVPQGHYMKRRERHVDSVVSMVTRETCEEELAREKADIS